MGEKFDLLEAKVEEVAVRLEQLKAENAALQQANSTLKSELASLRQQYDRLMLAHSDRSAAMKEKLQLMMSRLEELESLQA